MMDGLGMLLLLLLLRHLTCVPISASSAYKRPQYHSQASKGQSDQDTSAPRRRVKYNDHLRTRYVMANDQFKSCQSRGGKDTPPSAELKTPLDGLKILEATDARMPGAGAGAMVSIAWAFCDGTGTSCAVAALCYAAHGDEQNFTSRHNGSTTVSE